MVWHSRLTIHIDEEFFNTEGHECWRCCSGVACIQSLKRNDMKFPLVDVCIPTPYKPIEGYS